MFNMFIINAVRLKKYQGTFTFLTSFYLWSLIYLLIGARRFIDILSLKNKWNIKNNTQIIRFIAKLVGILRCRTF